MPQEKPVGIDLGTTNSAMAWLDGSGRSAMIANAEGELLTPSIVFFGETEVVVGKSARGAAMTHPEMTAQWVKREMGSPLFSHPIRGEHLPPEVIQACILRKLKTDIQRAVGPDSSVVITVPAYFDELRRKATADAGEMAGLKVLDIVNEPTAAALAYGEALGYLTPSGAPREEMNVLVYDLGGGTFDVTLLRLAAGKVETLATDGDVQLGGHDWDQRLVDYAAEAFLKAHQVDPRQDQAALNRLYQAATEAKHTLSARSRTAMRVEHAERSCEIQVVREQFEEMTADLLERTAYTCRQLLTAARLEWKDIARVLLVGGSTRMPMVSQMLRKMTGVEPDRTVNPDEAVARGAAVYAGHLLAQRDGAAEPSFQVTNVNAHSLGIEGIDPETMRKINVVIIPRNTRLPAKHTDRFATKSEGQRSIVVRVLEGESTLPGECIAIGRTVIRDLPGGLPKNWPIDVTFEYASNGRLAVQAVVPGTPHRAVLELERDVGISGEGIARWKSIVAAASGFDAFETAARDVLTAPVEAPAGDPGALSGIRFGLAAEGPEAPFTDALPGPVTAAAPFVSAPQPLKMPVVPDARFPGEPTGSPLPGPTAGPAESGSAPGTPAIAAPPVVAPADPPGAALEALATAVQASPKAPRRPPLIPVWLRRIIGHTLAAVLALGGAWGILEFLHWLRPDLFKLPW